MPTKFISYERLKRYTQNLKSYVGAQIQAAKTEWQNQLKLKVDKVTGKGLSTNDFTNEYKSKLDGIESGAQVNTVTGIKGNSESAYRTGNVNLTAANIGALEPSGDASNAKVTFTQSSGRVNLTSGESLKTTLGKLSKWYADLKAVAFSGSYNDLSNKPTAFKNPQSLTIQQNGGSQTEYDGSTKLTVNITKAGIGLGNVENKNSATIRGELTLTDVQNALSFDFDSTQAVSMCTHSKSGTVHTLVTKDGNTRYSIVRFVATADFTAGDTFRLGSSASTTVVTPKLENGDPLPTGAFKKNSVCIACTGDTSATINTLFFKGGGGLSSDVDLAAADAEPANVLTGKTFYAGDEEKKTGTMTNRGAVSASLAAGASYTVPDGYHNGSGVVSAQSLSSQTQASATSGDIVSGKTAYINGSKVTGSLAERPALTKPVSVFNDGTDIYIRIPTGAYRTLQSTGYPEVQLLQKDAINNLPGGKRYFGNAEYISLWTDQRGSAGPSGKKYIQSNHIPVGYYASDGKDYSPQVNAPAELFGNATADRVMKNTTFTSVNGACISGNLVAGFIDPVMYAQQYNPSYQSVINIVDIQVTRATLSLEYQDHRFVGEIIIQVNVAAQLNGGYTTENGQITIRNFEVFPDVLS